MTKTMILVITLGIVFPPFGFVLAVMLAAHGLSQEYTQDDA